MTSTSPACWEASTLRNGFCRRGASMVAIRGLSGLLSRAGLYALAEPRRGRRRRSGHHRNPREHSTPSMESPGERVAPGSLPKKTAGGVLTPGRPFVTLLAPCPFVTSAPPVVAPVAAAPAADGSIRPSTHPSIVGTAS